MCREAQHKYPPYLFCRVGVEKNRSTAVCFRLRIVERLGNTARVLPAALASRKQKHPCPCSDFSPPRPDIFLCFLESSFSACTALKPLTIPSEYCLRASPCTNKNILAFNSKFSRPAPTFFFVSFFPPRPDIFLCFLESSFSACTVLTALTIPSEYCLRRSPCVNEKILALASIFLRPAPTFFYAF